MNSTNSLLSSLLSGRLGKPTSTSTIPKPTAEYNDSTDSKYRSHERRPSSRERRGHRETRSRERRGSSRERRPSSRERRGSSRERRVYKRERSRSRGRRDRSDSRGRRIRSPRRRTPPRQERNFRDGRSRERKFSREMPRRDRSVTPLHLKTGKLDNWDKAPLGYDGLTVPEIKELGHFPAPGQPSRSVIQMGQLPSHVLPDFMRHTAVTQSIVFPEDEMDQRSKKAGVDAASKQALRLYMGGVSEDATEKSFTDLLNATMIKFKLTTAPGNPVHIMLMNAEKGHAFVEFRSPEETSAAVSLDGFIVEGTALKIRRPKDCNPTDEHLYRKQIPGTVSTMVSESMDKVFVGGIPTNLTEQQIMELLKSFGELKSFNLIRDVSNSTSKGFAFCEFENPEVTDIACQGLNGMELGDKKLIVQRASLGANPMNSASNAPGMPVSATSSTASASVLPPDLIAASSGPTKPSNVLLLLNLFEPEGIQLKETYQDIYDQIYTELTRYGPITDFKMPEPPSRDAGKVLIEFESVEVCEKALKESAGRTFDGRTVVGMFFPQDLFKAGVFSLE